jgi:hypothetical protein
MEILELFMLIMVNYIQQHAFSSMNLTFLQNYTGVFMIYQFIFGKKI